MPSIPSTSPATGEPTSAHFIHTIEGNFVDSQGRSLLLRGVNLSGASKAPVGQDSYVLEDFWEDAERGGSSFIGRPLNIEDGSADVHLARLRGWGFNMLRYPITWEALEHNGPKRYDDEFISYTIKVLKKCRDHGFRVFLDPHQDVWSRFSGGSGAPYWTLIACGMDARSFTATQAAILHSEYPTITEPDPASLPAMIWSTNYGKLASQTLFTLFFAGKDFAPKCIIDGVNIQDYLQSHFIEAFGHLGDRIRDEAPELYEECIIGWDSLNEPFEGLCGWPDLNCVPPEQTSTLRKGGRPTPAQSLRLGMGQAQTIEHWAFGTFGPRKDGTVTIDPKGFTIWLDLDTETGGVNEQWGWVRDPGWKLGKCLWAQHGVWDVASGYMLRPDYFACPPASESFPEKQQDFIATYWQSHFNAYAERIRQCHPEAILFVQPPVFSPPPAMSEELLKGRACYSAHYYDGLTLLTRHWNWFNADALGVIRGHYSSPIQAVKLGENAIRQSIQEQLGILKDDTKIIGHYPTLIGEIGIPYDMDNKRSYGYTDKGKYRGDYSRQQKALDASLNAADGPNAINYTIWNYTPENIHRWGDRWNMEDLGLWSGDDLKQRDTYHMKSASSISAVLQDSAHEQNVSVEPSPIEPSPIRPSEDAGVSGQITNLSKLTLSSIVREKATSKLDGDLFGWDGHWGNPYDFLTDGARAFRAFSRPWPHAVVGSIRTLSFDIAKAEFKMAVLVRPTDLPPPSTGDNSPTSSADTERQDGGLAELATEIYVPLVHFASEILLATATNADLDPGRTKNLADSDGDTLAMSRQTSTANLLATLTPASSETLASCNWVDVEVDVSAGRWKVQGQHLFWWYPIPASADVEHNITIRRRNGAIKQLSDDPGEDSSFWSWCANLCPPESCTLM